MGYFESPLLDKLDILDKFGQCPKCPKPEVIKPRLHGAKNLAVSWCRPSREESGYVDELGRRLGLTSLQVELLDIKPESKSLNSIELG